MLALVGERVVFHALHCGSYGTDMPSLHQTSATCRFGGALIALVCCYSLVGCDSAATQQAKRLVEADLVDPGSVQYREVRQFKDGTVCGQFNAKNRMGGYSGFEWFAVYQGKLVPNRLYHIALCSDSADKISDIKRIVPTFKTEADRDACVRRINQQAAMKALAAQTRGLDQRFLDECGSSTNVYAK